MKMITQYIRAKNKYAYRYDSRFKLRRIGDIYFLFRQRFILFWN